MPSSLLTHGRGGTALIMAVMSVATLLGSADCARASLVWESLGFSDGQAIAGGTALTASTGTGVMIGRSEFTDNDSGGSDISPGGNADFVTYQRRPLGGHRSHLSLSLDNLHDDPADYVELTLQFEQAVTNLQFSVLDVDGNSGWDDGVEVYYNGLNVRDDPAVLAINGSYTMLDDKPYIHGWEGTGSNAGNGQTAANIDFDFGALSITSLTIRFFSTTDGGSNPAEQQIGLSDLTFNAATPEPSSLACTAMLLVILVVRRRSRLACSRS